MKTMLAAATAASVLFMGLSCLAQPANNGTTTPPAKTAGPVDIPSPPDGKGEIVFYRRSAFTGVAVWFNVRENGAQLGKLSNGVYFVVAVDPGTHTFTAATENKDKLKLNIDPGEIYYVEGRLSVGLLVGEANLAPTDEASFEKVASNLKRVTSSPPPAAAAAASN